MQLHQSCNLCVPSLVTHADVHFHAALKGSHAFSVSGNIAQANKCNVQINKSKSYSGRVNVAHSLSRLPSFSQQILSWLVLSLLGLLLLMSGSYRYDLLRRGLFFFDCLSCLS